MLTFVSARNFDHLAEALLVLVAMTPGLEFTLCPGRHLLNSAR